MAASIGQALPYLLIPTGATIAGGVYAAFRSPGPQMRSAVQHFAAGVVFAAAAGEILPDVVERHRPWEVALGFSLGIAAMLAIRAFADRAEGQEGAGGTAASAIPLALLVTLGVDIIVDGLLLGIGFAAGEEEGILLTIALTVELLFLGLAAATALGKGGSSRRRIILVTTGLALLLGVGAVLGTLVLSRLPGAGMEIMLSFGLAALLYLVTEELLVEAHEVPETPWTTATFFLGFLALLMLEMSMSGAAPAG